MKSHDLQHYQNCSCPDACQLLQGDAITFSVLISILKIPCSDIYTDHESLILCFSQAPYPVWVWAKDPSDLQDMQRLAACLKEAFPMEKGFSYNIGYEVLAALKQTDPYFQSCQIKMGLLSYRLDQVNPLDAPCGGHMAPARLEDMDLLARLWHQMHLEMEGMELEDHTCRERVAELIRADALFSWISPQGELVALTSRWDSPPYSKIAAVFTLPQHRRRGYAINLVHRITQSILDDGLTPILYTDAGYTASNSCYTKIGYRQVGSLCTVCHK